MYREVKMQKEEENCIVFCIPNKIPLGSFIEESRYENTGLPNPSSTPAKEPFGLRPKPEEPKLKPKEQIAGKLRIEKPASLLKLHELIKINEAKELQDKRDRKFD